MKSAVKKRLLLIVVLVAIIVAIVFVWKNKGEKNPGEGDLGGTEIAQQGGVDNVGEYVKVLEDGSKLNTSEELKKEKKVKGLKITNAELKENNGITTLLADVENTSKKATKEQEIKVRVLDKEGNTITTLNGLLDVIEAGGKSQINVAVTSDVSNAYDFEIVED